MSYGAYPPPIFEVKYRYPHQGFVKILDESKEEENKKT